MFLFLSGHIAHRASEEYGFIGTASVILKTALNTSRDPWSDQTFEADLARIVAETVKVHNGYLERHRSVFTDTYTFKPYLLDSKLRSSVVHSHWSSNVEAWLSLVQSVAGASSLMP